MKYMVKIDNLTSKVYLKCKIWNIEESYNKRIKNTKRKTRLFKKVKYTTKELFDRFQRTKNKPTLRLKNKVSYYKEKPLPIHPYILGYWLGDGYSSEGCIVVHNKLVKELIKNFKSCGYSITSVRQIGISSCYLIRPNYKGTPLRTLLRKNNLLNNKHIPKDYIYNSVENRRELIRGLCDSDGSIDKKGRSKFAQKNINIMNNFSTILWSLGIKNYPKTQYTTLKKTNKTYKIKKVYFHCYNFNPFKFKYKRRRNKKEYAIRVKYNYIRNITFVPIFL